MIQRDIIQQQIEQLGRALGKIITAFLGLKSQGKVAEGLCQYPKRRDSSSTYSPSKRPSIGSRLGRWDYH